MIHFGSITRRSHDIPAYYAYIGRILAFVAGRLIHFFSTIAFVLLMRSKNCGKLSVGITTVLYGLAFSGGFVFWKITDTDAFFQVGNH